MKSNLKELNFGDLIVYYINKITSYFLYGVAIVMVICVPLIHIIKIVPFYLSYYPIPISLLLIVFLSTTLFYSIVYYIRGVREPFLPLHDESELHQFTNQSLENSQFVVCKKCHTLKPLRCHHCSKCNHCIYRMDHHCSWFGGCVGAHNIRFFFLFLVSLGITTLFAALSSFPQQKRDDLTRIIFIVELVLGVVLCFYAVFHFALLLTNQTTLELSDNCYRFMKEPSSIRKFISPYNLGFKINCKQALRYNHPSELLNPFARLTPINEMDVIISNLFDEYFDKIDSYVEEEKIENNQNKDHVE